MILKNKSNKIIRKNKKALATIYSAILYIFISVAVIGMVSSFAITFINEQQENYKYEIMLDQINKLDTLINNTANNKLNINKTTIRNPEYLEIDCNSNLIKGYINFNKEYKEGRILIDGITTYKQLNKLYFEKLIDYDNKLNLNCKSLVFNKGKNNLDLQYFNYDSEDEVVNIDLYRSKPSRTNNWYNSNWLYRSKIDINSELVEGDLIDFPILIESEDFNLLQYSKSDGSDIVFTLGDGRTKLYREIEDYNAQQLPYYIEEESEDNYNLYTIINLKANSTKNIFIKKEIGQDMNLVSDFNLEKEDSNTIKNIIDLDNDLYKINITNITSEDLNDYQIKLPGESLDIDTNTETLKLYSGKLTAWVKIPKLLSNEDQFIYMYYGNDQGEEVDSTNVWNDDFTLIQHLNNNIIDSTIKENITTQSGITDSQGKIGSSYKFTNGNDYIYNETEINNNSYTISLWLNPEYNFIDKPNVEYIFATGDQWTSRNLSLESRVCCGEPYDLIFYTTPIDGNSFKALGTEANYISWLANNWYYITTTFYTNEENSSNVRIYENGILLSQGSKINYDFNFYNRIYIGNKNNTNIRGFNGKIDEFRISRVRRSENWIKTEYNNQSDVSKFININNMERI